MSSFDKRSRARLEVYSHCWFSRDSLAWTDLVARFNYVECKYGTKHITYFARCCCTFIEYRTNGKGYDKHESTMINVYETIGSRNITCDLLVDFLFKHGISNGQNLMFPGINVVHDHYLSLSDGQLIKRKPEKLAGDQSSYLMNSIKSSTIKSMDYTPLKPTKKPGYTFDKDKYWNHSYQKMLSERKNVPLNNIGAKP